MRRSHSHHRSIASLRAEYRHAKREYHKAGKALSKARAKKKTRSHRSR